MQNVLCLCTYRRCPLLLLFLICFSGCTSNRTKVLVEAYHAAEPPNELFIGISEAKYLGTIDGYSLLYYSFAWSGGSSERGTHKLLIFAENKQYKGYYYLGDVLNTKQCKVNENLVMLVFIDGSREKLDFSNGLPEASEDRDLLFDSACLSLRLRAFAVKKQL